MIKGTDLTISECLRDPLIAVLMHADGVKLEDLRQLLEAAARNWQSKLDNCLNTGARGWSTEMHTPLQRTGDAVSLIGMADV